MTLREILIDYGRAVVQHMNISNRGDPQDTLNQAINDIKALVPPQKLLYTDICSCNKPAILGYNQHYDKTMEVFSG